MVSAGSRLPWPAGRWGHEGRGARGVVRAKFRGRPSAPSRRRRLPFSSFLPAQVVSGCGLSDRPAPPASQHPRPYTCCGRPRLPPCPPQEAPPLRPEPRKGTLRSSSAFLFLTGGSFSWSPALPRRRPLILTISPPSPYAIFISLPWTLPYNPSSCQRCLCPSKTRATCCKTRPSLHAMCQGRKALPPPGDRGSLFALGGPDSSLCPEQ